MGDPHVHFGAVAAMVWERANIHFEVHFSNVRALMTQEYMCSKDVHCKIREIPEF